MMSGLINMEYNSEIILALNICTYKRQEYLYLNLKALRKSKFFDASENEYFGNLHIFVVDNASELEQQDFEYVHVIHNKNTGGSGGFQRGLEEIRKSKIPFSHIIFMDDDVRFELESFYLLFNFLCGVDAGNRDRPVAGRMFNIDYPNIQWTAAEIWNGGNIKHVEFLRDVSVNNIGEDSYQPGKVVYDSGAEYGGWWFCCFPMSFAKTNDILPFFLHCDDVEYGLRCGKSPIIIEGVQVWHETYEKKMSHTMLYYNTRNSMFVNELYGILPPSEEVLQRWKETIANYHVKQDWLSEYAVIKAMWDFLKGLDWMKEVDSEANHNKIARAKSHKLKNVICWRVVEYMFRKKYHIR